MMKLMPRNDDGFTLLEILLTLTITAVMASLLYFTLSNTYRTYHVITVHRQLLHELQNFLRIWQSDMTTVATQQLMRISQNNSPSVSLNTYPNTHLAVTKVNFSHKKPMQLNKVSYYVQDHTLMRSTNTTQQKLITNVTSWHVSVYDKDNKKLATWPFYPEVDEPPRAIEITLCIKTAGCLTRYVLFNGNDTHVFATPQPR